MSYGSYSKSFFINTKFDMHIKNKKYILAKEEILKMLVY